MRIDTVATWDQTFMGFAQVAARRSKDPSTQVGACVVSEDRRVLSIGYNGATRGFEDESFPWGKVGSTLDTKYAFVVHAEANAILNYRGNSRDLEGATVYVTLFPCNECAKTLAQAGVREVVYAAMPENFTDFMKASQLILHHAGVSTRKVELPL